jgi:hypothetical protein
MRTFSSWAIGLHGLYYKKQIFLLKLIKEKIKWENQSITDGKTLIISGQLAHSLFLYYGTNAML